MPRSTSSRPKLLCTASALTMGTGLMPSMPPGEQYGQFLRRRGWCMEGDEHLAEALQWGQRESPLGAAAEIALQVVLADGQNRRHREVPDAGDDRQFDHLERGAGDLLRSGEQLGNGRDKGE